MRNRLLGLAVVAGLSAFASGSPTVAAQQRGQTAPPAGAAKLPPLVYTCPMPGDEAVLEDKPGTCPNPKCGMQLVATRLDSKWWCPTHQTLEVRDAPGKCRRDGRELVQVTLSEWWTCPGSENHLMDPGSCGDGSPRRIKYEIRAHGDHNPRHGGQFFMAEDQWHHIEGTYPSAGLFKVFFYDNFTKPMEAKGFAGSFVILNQSFKEVASFPLKMGADGRTMEARIPPAQSALPLNGAVRIAFTPTTKPQLFNFPFTSYSKEPAATTNPTSTVAAPAKPQAGTTRSVPFAASMVSRAEFSWRALGANTAQAPAGTAAQQPAPNVLDSPLQITAELANALDEERLPATVPALIVELTRRVAEIQKLVSEGSLGQAWLPAMGTKTVALVLESKSGSLSEQKRAVAAAAAKRVITAAWEIDAFGDLGNGEKIAEAFGRMQSAVAELKGAYEPAR